MCPVKLSRPAAIGCATATHQPPLIELPLRTCREMFPEHSGDAYPATAMIGSSIGLLPSTFSYCRPKSQAMGNQQAAMTIPRTARPAIPKGSTAALSQDELRSPKRLITVSITFLALY